MVLPAVSDGSASSESGSNASGSTSVSFDFSAEVSKQSEESTKTARGGNL